MDTKDLQAQIAKKAALYEMHKKLSGQTKPRATFELPQDEPADLGYVASKSLSGDFALFTC